jgi:hypothetical protein
MLVLPINLLIFLIQAKPSKWFYIPWIFILLPYMMYESVINIYFFVSAFNARHYHSDNIFIVRSYGVRNFLLYANIIYVKSSTVQHCLTSVSKAYIGNLVN